MSYSWQTFGNSVPIEPLPQPNSDGTYDWAKILAIRKGVRRLPPLTGPGSGQPFVITQDLNYQGADGNQIGPFKLDAPPRWIALIGTEYKPEGKITVTFTSVAGQTTQSDRVVRVAWIGAGLGGGMEKFTEYYFPVVKPQGTTT